MELSEPATSVCLLFDIDTLKQKAKITTQSELEKWWKSNEWQNKLYLLVGEAGDKNASYAAFDPTVWPSTTGNRNKLQKESFYDLEGGKYGYNDAQVKAIKSDTQIALYNIAGGISGAISIYAWMKADHNGNGKGRSGAANGIPDTIYLTGTNWHKDIAKFKVASSGMDDFNSSDIVIGMGTSGQNPEGIFYGVSLKKKKIEAASGDPTLINRSFSESIRNVNRSRAAAGDMGSNNPNAPATIKEANKFLNKLEEIKWDFFGSIITDTTQYPIAPNSLTPDQLKKAGVKSPNQIKNPRKGAVKKGQMSFKEMAQAFEGIDIPPPRQIPKKNTEITTNEAICRYRDKKARYSSAKPLLEMKGGPGRSGPMRKLVNSRIASDDNAYFKAIKALLNGKPVSVKGKYVLTGAESTEIMSEMAEELTDHIFKITLKGRLKARKSLQGYYFGFGICTQVGDIKYTKKWRVYCFYW